MTEQLTGEAVPDATSVSVAPSRRELAYSQYALVIFLLCHAAKGLDAQAFSILVPPIKAEFHLSDTQMGVISGLSFAFFFAIVGIPIGRLADRTNRRNIIAAMLAIFSAMTILGGMVTSFWQMAVSRMGVGLGEGGVAPPVHSMIADMFPVQKRSTAMSFYAAGSYIGAGVGFLIAGWINQYYGWRVAMFTVGAPGIVLALVVWLTLREPVRGSSDGLGHAATTASSGSLFEAARFMWSQRSFRHLVLATGLAGLGTNAFTGWIPTYLSRSFGMSSGHVGTSLAVITAVVAGGGTLLSGRILDHFGKTDIRRGLWLLAVIQLIRFPVSAIVLLSQGPVAALVFYAFMLWCTSFNMAPTAAYVQSLAPVRIRATASSLMYLIFTILGVGAGPLVVGAISDLLSAEFGKESVRYALLATTGINLWAAAHYLWAARTIRDDITRAKGAA